MESLGWKPICRIGGGRFSDVYKVINTSQKEKTSYSLKLVDPDDEKPPHNIRNEIKILSDLKKIAEKEKKINPNVILLDNFLFNNIEYGLIFPLLDLTLNQVIKTHVKTRTIFNNDGTMKTKKVNSMPIEKIFRVILGVLNGLSWIHSHGIIHRDINPNNILFSKDDLDTPLIIDFGISYQEPDNNGLEKEDRKFTDIATGIYKAPEILLSKRDYSNKVDIWAVGILMILMLSKDGKPIFDEDSGYSDLVLLSNILTTFGSPPEDWTDCKGLVSFDSLNRSFFTKSPKPLEDIVPILFEDPTLNEYSSKLKEVFIGVTKYETKQRLSAEDALNILNC